MTALGPAVGFLLGAALLSVYVDPGNAPVGLEDTDSQWVGAWWIGVLVCSGAVLLVSIPMLIFPKQLPGMSVANDEDRPVAMGFGKNLTGKYYLMVVILLLCFSLHVYCFHC